MSFIRESFTVGRLILYALSGFTTGLLFTAIELWGEHSSVRRSIFIGAVATVLISVSALIGDITRGWLEERRRRKVEKFGGPVEW